MVDELERVVQLCADRLLDLVDRLADLDRPKGALLLCWWDHGDPLAPVAADPVLVFEDDRRRAAAEIDDWRELWIYDGLPNGMATEPEAQQLPDLAAQRGEVTRILLERGAATPDAEFWPMVARHINASTPPRNADASWAAVAVSMSRDIAVQIRACVDDPKWRQLRLARYVKLI